MNVTKSYIIKDASGDEYIIPAVISRQEAVDLFRKMFPEKSIATMRRLFVIEL